MSGPGSLPDPRLYASLGRIESGIVDQQLSEEGYREDKDDSGLTIFIPNWNHRAFLPRALRSALDALESLRKEGFSAEILVIDDASRDGSQKLLRTVQALYNDPRLRTVCLSQNLGLTNLRNLALRACRYRHVLTLDADNELLPGNVPLFVRAAKETGAALIYGNLLDIQDEEIVGIRSNMPTHPRIAKRNYVDGFAVTDAPVVSSLGGYRRAHPYSPDDWEMVLHLMAEERDVVFVPAVMGYYHKLGGSGSEENKPFNEAANAALKRAYAQTGFRDWDEEPVGRIYCPDVGFIDEW